MQFGPDGYLSGTTNRYPWPTLVLSSFVPQLEGRVLDAERHDSATGYRIGAVRLIDACARSSSWSVVKRDKRRTAANVLPLRRD